MDEATRRVDTEITAPVQPEERLVSASAITMSRHVDLPYADAVARIKATLKDEGFGLLTEIDVQATLREKIGAEFRAYTILDACNPGLAHRALKTSLEVGALLPCNVLVYEDDGGGSTVSIFDPATGMSVVAVEGLDAIAAEARERLSRALAAV